MTDEELQTLREQGINSVADVRNLFYEVARLRGIEDKALAQSEYIQTHGLTEYEQARLQAEVDRLRARCDSQAKWISMAQEHMSPSALTFLAKRCEETP
jgi:hypothetical protein